MARRSRLQMFLLILRFTPIITQLVDDVITDFRSEESPKGDPLHASKMRAALVQDDVLVNEKLRKIRSDKAASDQNDALIALGLLKAQVDKQPGMAFNNSLQRLLNDAENHIRSELDVLDPEVSR